MMSRGVVCEARRSEACRVLWLVASFPESLLTFRGPLIAALLSARLSVHVAAPALSSDVRIRSSLERMGVEVHDIPLSRTGTNLWDDLKLVFHLYRLIREIKPVA